MRTAAVRRVVEAAGRARFRARVARLEGDLAAVEPDQVVWRGVAEALGYTRNTAPFGRLADVVPWSDAAEAVAWRGPLGLAGLLLGTAGLLAEASLAEAHAFRAFERARNARQMLTAAAWDRRQQRAANSPAQRCRGLAELAARWTSSPSSTRVMPALEARTADWPLDRSDSSAQRRAGPTDLAKAAVDWLRDPIGSSAQGGAGPAEKVLAAVGEAARCGRRRPRPLWRLVHAPPWIGRGRAQVVVVNVLVPFAVAAGCVEAAELFERLSGEPTNRVLRYMAAQLGQGTTAPEQVRFTGALLQQGLLQLFSATCATRLCGACPARGASWPWHDA